MCVNEVLGIRNAHGMAARWWRDHSFLRRGVGSNTPPRQRQPAPSIEIFHQCFASSTSSTEILFCRSLNTKTLLQDSALHKTHLPQLKPSQFVREAEMYFVVIVTSCLPYWLSLCRGEKLPGAIVDASYSCFWPPRHALVLLSFPLCFPHSPRHACPLCVVLHSNLCIVLHHHELGLG